MAPALPGSLNYDLNALALLMRDWASETLLAEHGLATFLMTENLNDLHPLVTGNPRTSRVKVPLPSPSELAQVFQLIGKQYPTALSGYGTDMATPAAELAGATVSAVESLLKTSQYRSDPIDPADLTQLKKQLVEQDCGGLIEFLEPDRTLEDLHGQETVKAWLRQDIALWNRGEGGAMPMGYLLCGPVGTGKTFLVECLAGEAHIPVIKLRNFRDRWIGSTEGNLERIFRLIHALGRCYVFVDQADQALGRRDSNTGDSGVSGRVYSMLAEEMSDTRNRGNGVVTWTPRDVTVAHKKGGLVSIVSTKEYSSQMPCVVIGIDKWMKANKPLVENMIQAIAEGGDQVKSNGDALHHAAEISALVYHEAGTDASYWEKYYNGVQEQDSQGLTVDLGGSQANNLADSLLAFGLIPQSANLVAATYQVFGNIVVAQFPKLVPSYPPASEVIDSSYLQDVAKREAPTAAVIAAQNPTYQKASPVKHVISRRAWSIHFNAGKATFSQDAARLLDQLSRELLVASGTVVEVHGYTDNQGSSVTSMPLSEARAFAVKNWLEKKTPVNFPPGRIRVFPHGDTNPIAPNSTPEGRALNRRVEIVTGTTSA